MTLVSNYDRERILPSLLLLLAAILPVTASAQSSLTLAPVDLSRFPILSAPFLAVDDRDSVIDGLTAGDLRVDENGTPRKVLRVICPPPTPPVPLSALLSIDVSSSMGERASGVSNLSIATSAARAWIDLFPNDGSECAVTSFDNAGYLNHDFTTDRPRLHAAVNALTPLAGTSYDSGLAQRGTGALHIVATGSGRRIVVFLTDGLAEADVENIVKLANGNGVTIHCVVVGMEAPDVLREIATRTGGFWFENVRSAEEAGRIYRLLLEYSIRGGLCRVEWESAPGCERTRNVVVSVPGDGLRGETSYKAPDAALVTLDVSPAGVSLSSVPPGSYRDTTITITAGGEPVDIAEIRSGDPRFTVIAGGTPPSFTLKPGESRKITVRYTPTDSSYAFARIEFLGSACDTPALHLAAGFPGRPPDRPTLALTVPNGGEVYNVGADTVIAWSGVLPEEPVRLEYSIDGGSVWNPVAEGVVGLKRRWTVPNTPSRTCLMRVVQLSRDSTLELKGHTDQVVRAHFSADGTRVVTAGFDSTARIWDAYTGALLFTLSHPGRVRSAKFSADGRYVVTGCTDGSARIWTVAAGTLHLLLRDPAASVGEGTSVEFSPDGRMVLTSGVGAKPDNDAELWDAGTGTLLRRLRGHTSYVTTASFNMDGTRVVTSGGYDLTVKVWDPFTGAEFLTIPNFPSIVHAVNWSPDGRYLVTASTTIQIWDAVTGGLVRDIPTGGFQASFSPDGRTLAVCNYVAVGGSSWITLWDVTTATPIRSFEGYRDGSWCVDFNDNGLRIVSAEKNHTARIWNLGPEPIQSDISDSLWAITAPKLSMRNVAFGTLTVGMGRDSIVAALLCNEGEAPVPIRRLAITGPDSADFGFVSGGGAFLLGPGECREVELRFTPRAVGRRSAVLEADAPGLPRATVEGVGEAPALEVTTPWIDFGAVRVGETRDSLVPVMLRNNGTVPVSMTGIERTGPDTMQFSVVDGGGTFDLLPGESRTMTLRFAPTSRGRTDGGLRFRLGSGPPATARLFGLGICSSAPVATVISLPDTMIASAGEFVTIPVRLSATGDLAGSGAGRFILTVRADETLLLPLDSVHDVRHVDGDRIVSYMGEWNDTTEHLIDLNFLAALGSRPETPIRIELFRWELDCPIAVTTVDGLFRLRDLCREGESVRLFDAEGAFGLKPVRPNPAGDRLALEFILNRPERARLTIVDMSGRPVRALDVASLPPGPNALEIDLEGIPAGPYTAVLDDGGERYGRTFMIER